MRICSKVQQLTQQDTYVEIATNGATVRIYFLTDEIVRIRAGFDGDFAEESYSLMMTGWEDRLDELWGDKRTRITPVKPIVEETVEVVEEPVVEETVEIDEEPAVEETVEVVEEPIVEEPVQPKEPARVRVRLRIQKKEEVTPAEETPAKTPTAEIE